MIKIDDSTRPSDAVGYIDVNRGKRGNVDHLETPAHLFSTPIRLGGRPTPVPGGNTREILHELGYSATAMAHYIAKGAVRAATTDS